MMNKPSVLVTGVGACGVGEGIAKALRMADRYSIIAVNADANAPELFEADHRYLVPRATESGYLDAIDWICAEHNVRAVLPGSEPEAAVLAPLKSRFGAVGISVLTNPQDVVKTCQDKWLTYEFLIAADLPTPRTFRPHHEPSYRDVLGFPMILKPRAGHASQDVFVVHSQAELDSYLDHFERIGVEPLAQQYVPGDEEFTCSSLVGDDGEELGSIAMKRELMGGFSQKVVVDEFPAASDLTRRVASALEAWGPINVQCRRWEDSYWIFEINARFSGSAPFRAMVGFNEPDILVQYVLTGEVPSHSIRYGLVGMRRLEEVLVPTASYDSVAVARPGKR